MSRDPVTPERIHAQARGEAASQSTVIEQSRAIAEVQGALVVAQQRPRDETTAINRIREAGKQLALAEQAFFEFPRGGKTVSGESIHLATEMARCWGNLAYGIVELSRDNGANESEMLAYAWDLETNTRSQLGFIVPHRRDTQGGGKLLTDMRDIYENNANMGARRLRECIFRILPVHVREIGKSTCLATLEKGETEQPLNVRLAVLIEQAEALGISRARIEARFGAVTGMTTVSAASLHVALRSVKRNEVKADEAFPRVGTDEATEAARKLVDQSKPAAAAKGQDTVTDENPNAEEGAGDEDRGEAHNNDDDDLPSDSRIVADEILRAIPAQGNIIDLAHLKAARQGDMEALPADMAAEVNQAFTARELELRRKTGK